MITTLVSSAQNLVPNSSFEDYNQCPHGAFIDINVWTTYGGTPDYYNVCSVSPYLGVPYNWVGYQNPVDGVAYVGVVTYAVLVPPATYREYIGAPLIQPLTIGTKYFVSAYISRGYSTIATGATNKFGFRFSTVPYFNTIPVHTDNFSHIHSDSLIMDSINWTRIEGSFIADSSYQYIILGNFYNNASTDTIDLQGMSAYYYVDMVCLSPDSFDCPVITHINKQTNEEDIQVFPNPFNSQLNLSFSKNNTHQLVLYDIISGKKTMQVFKESGSLNTSQLPSGIYFYEIYTMGNIVKKGKLIKQ